MAPTSLDARPFGASPGVVACDRLLKLLVASISADCAMFVVEPDGRIASWNHGAELVAGYSADEIVGRHVSVLYTREEVRDGAPERDLRVAAEKGRCEVEAWRLRKGGERFWANVVITALRADDGALVGYAKVTRDLTERRRAEERLREVEERFRLFVESVQDYALFLLDVEGNVTTWNRGAERLKGWRADEIVGRHFSTFYTPEDRAAGRPERLLAAAREHGRVGDEGWRVRKDGERFWADVVITAIRDASGKLCGYGKVTRDLTERRAHEERLRREEAARAAAEAVARRLAAIQLVSDAALAALETHAFLDELLVRVRQMLDADMAAVLLAEEGSDSLTAVAANGLDGFVPPVRVPVGTGVAGTIASTRAPLAIEDTARAAGVPPILRSNVRSVLGVPLVADDRVLGVLEVGFKSLRTFAADDFVLLEVVADRVVFALERARALDALRESETRFRQLADAMPQIVWVSTADGRVVYANRRWKQVLGEPLPQSLDGWLAFTDPEGANGFVAALGAAIRDGRPVELEVRLRAAGDGLRWHLARAVPVRDPAGAVVRWYGTLTDVEEQKRVQAMLETAVRSRDEFLSIAGHELNTPLTTLTLQLAGLRRSPPNPQTSAQRLATIERQVARLTKLASELLDVSRLTGGTLRLERDPVDLVALVREVVHQLEPDAQQAGSDVRLAPAEPIVGDWDRLRIEQVVTNLVSNAIKYGRGKPIDVRVEQDGELARVVVRDRGIGIDPEAQQRIFDRFERGVPAKNFGGFGLGLWIARQIVEAHGGRIRVESAPGRGATFVVELPRSAPVSGP